MALDIKTFPTSPFIERSNLSQALRPGDLLFASGSGKFSSLIKWCTGSVWSHVAFLLKVDMLDSMMVMESVENIGVRCVPLDKYLTDYDSKFHPYNGGLVVARHKKITAALRDSKNLETLTRTAVDLLGYPYDGDEIAKIAARIAISTMTREWGEPKELTRDREFICSEFVEECFRSVGVQLHGAGYITPSDVAATREVDLVAVLQTLPSHDQ